MRTAAMIAGVVLIAGGPALSAEKLAGEALKDTVSGKQIYLATPFGGEFPLNYRANGQVDGSGKAIGLGKWMQPTDSGSWWIDGEKLCQKWRTWYDGKRFCFTVKSTGPKQIAWTRDDGLSGTARIQE